MPQIKKLCTCGKTRTPPYCDHSHGSMETCPKASPINISAIPNKILLVMLPYWDPLIPPQGISHLKTFLQHHGYVVKTEDANIRDEFKVFYNKYFALLRKYVPEDKHGNFFNIGHDVMRNHMIAHINYINEQEHIELVKTIIYSTFFTYLNDQQVMEVKNVLDLFYKTLENYMLHLLMTERPSILGITVLRDTIGPALFAFRFTKEKYPFIKTIMGGSVFSDHLLPGTPNFETFLEKTPFIDNIIIGEGQILLLKLLRGELPGSQKVFTLEDIQDERVGYTPLNSPDMTDFNVQKDYPYLAAQASSSCPFQCSFCNVAAYFGKYKRKDPKQTVEEMIALYKKYGVQVFFMNDALLNGIAPALSEEFIKADVTLYWDGYLRVDKTVCDPENTFQWRRGGFYRARLGVESGSQHVLDLMHKGITPDQIKEALFSLAHAGIKTTAYWVIGHPGETEEDFRQTLQLLDETKNNIYEAECNPFIYGYSGQADSQNWKDKRKQLYPEKARDMLILQTWYIETEPSREVTYERVNRFVAHCKKLGIPNPYSLHEIYNADKRWKELHRNAVPPLALLNDQEKHVDENKYVKKEVLLQNTLEEKGDFGFDSI